MPARPSSSPLAAAPSSSRPPALLHYSHHSVGLGHLVRSLAIAGGLAERFRVVLCSGGPVPAGIRVPPGVDLVELPPIGAGSDGELASLNPTLPLDEAWTRRAEMLLSLYAAVAPDAIVVELFPFGRTKFARELIPLLQAARTDPRPVTVVSSVRDLLVTARRDQQGHDDLAAARLRQYFDAVVVHADERFARLEETFRPTRAISIPVLSSGFVVPRASRPPRRLRVPGEVLVSAGGGSAGGPLLRAAAAAHRLELAARGFRTRLVTGPFLPEPDVAELRAEAATSSSLTVERFVPDLCEAMAGAAVSVSQAGYNTTLDVLRSGVPAIVVPYGEGRENEQPERARRLARLGAVTVLPASALTPERLAATVTGAAAKAPPRVALDLDGVSRTAELVSELVARATRRRAA